jgi:lipopolysaccharide assembly outer membrane protein LptD (OstA)
VSKWILAAMMGVSSTVSISASAAIGENVKLTAASVVKDSHSKALMLIGDARVEQAAHHITANKIIVNQKAGTLSASGNCQYTNGRITREGDAMNFKIEDGKWSQTE